MTSVVDIINRGLQAIGTRTTVTAAELAANSTNEAIQINLCYQNIRDDLSRMAPWNCTTRTANLVYITSVPGTPENTSPATQLWQPGQPSPPWSYEFQYPIDCLRACRIVPAQMTGFTGVPITSAVTGYSPSTWLGGPIVFKVATDDFYPVLSAAIVSGGTGAAVGDIITLAGTVQGSVPIGAPAQLLVTSAPGGVVAAVTVVNQLMDSDTATGGSYFSPQTGTIAQGSTTGSGIGFTCALTFGPKGPQRVILTNQEYATMIYCTRVTDPDVMDTLFQSAWSALIGATVSFALSGDKSLANGLVARANTAIEDARKADGNEGLTINDVTPDWIRIRGTDFTEGQQGPWGGFDWGPLWSTF